MSAQKARRRSSIQRTQQVSPSIISSFTCGMGLYIGFSRAGFETRYANDITRFACDTIRENKKQVHCDEGDITEIYSDEILKIIGILNLMGRSGYLLVSCKMIDYMVGRDSGQILAGLEKKSIITYRQHAGEYRIWHGTDVDIAAKLDMYRKRLAGMHFTQQSDNFIKPSYQITITDAEYNIIVSFTQKQRKRLEKLQ